MSTMPSTFQVVNPPRNEMHLSFTISAEEMKAAIDAGRPVVMGISNPAGVNALVKKTLTDYENAIPGTNHNDNFVYLHGMSVVERSNDAKVPMNATVRHTFNNEDITIGSAKAMYDSQTGKQFAVKINPGDSDIVKEIIAESAVDPKPATHTYVPFSIENEMTKIVTLTNGVTGIKSVKVPYSSPLCNFAVVAAKSKDLAFDKSEGHVTIPGALFENEVIPEAKRVLARGREKLILPGTLSVELQPAGNIKPVAANVSLTCKFIYSAHHDFGRLPKDDTQKEHIREVPLPPATVYLLAEQDMHAASMNVLNHTLGLNTKP